MNISQLNSRDNPILKKIRLVSAGARRAPKDLVLAEGIRVLEEVVRTGYPVEAVLFREGFGTTGRERRLLEAWGSSGIRLYRTGEKLFKAASNVQAPQGALALVKVPEVRLSDIAPARNSLVVYGYGIQDPGNLGTLIRTAAAAGASLLCTNRGTVSSRNPKSIRSSAGAFFHLVPVENLNITDFLEFCRRYSIQPYRTDIREGINYSEADLRSPCAIMLGNEGRGLNAGKLNEVPPVRIPMKREIESLNVATAGAVILFEAARQRSIYG